MGRASRAKRERKQVAPAQPTAKQKESVWKILGSHPVIPTAAGALMTLDGAGNVGIKSWAILGCTVWLCIDLWPVLKERITTPKRRNILYFLTCAAISLLSIFSVRWLRNQHFKEEQAQVKKSLIAEALTFPNESPYKSVFTVTNASGIDVGQHDMMCHVNLAVSNVGTPSLVDPNLTSKFFKDDLSGDQGQQTYSCLDVVINERDEVDCLDVTLIFDYVLADQPSENLSKYFRFMATRESGFVWRGQPADDPTEFCTPFLSANVRRSFHHSVTPLDQIRNSGGFYKIPQN